MSKTGWLLYESQDALLNQWFIEKLQKDCAPLKLDLVYTDFISDAYDMNLKDMADDMLKRKETPDFIINRSRDHGIAYEFEKRGIRLFNPARVTETANDKDLSYRVAEQMGLKYMPYITIEGEELAPLFSISGFRSLTGNRDYDVIKDKADDFGYPFVLKPADGHGGKYVYLINSEPELKHSLQELINGRRSSPCKKLLMQRVASVRGRDLRVYFINNSIIVGMLRSSGMSNDFRANFSLGGIASVHTLTREERFLVNELTDALPSDYIGIDLIYDKGGTPVFNEYEDVVGSRMVYTYTDIDIVSLFADHIRSVIL